MNNNTLTDRLRSIGARLCLNEETKLDGRMVLACADEAARIESELAEISENAEEYVAALNDPLNAASALVAKLVRRKARAVDGSPYA